MNVLLDQDEIQRIVAANGEPITIQVKGSAQGPQGELVLMFEGEVSFSYVAGIMDGLLKGLGTKPHQPI